MKIASIMIVFPVNINKLSPEIIFDDSFHFQIVSLIDPKN